MMRSRVCHALTIAVMSMAAFGANAQQSSTNQVSAKTDWSVFEDKNPHECWAVTTFKESVNTRDGRVVAVRRGDILLMVFYRPEVGVKGQVGFTGGYPFAEGSTVKLEVDGKTFDLFTDGEWAWPASEAEDAKIVAAMKSGSKATATAKSTKGTKTVDSFSLLGFTAALEDAIKRCEK